MSTRGKISKSQIPAAVASNHPTNRQPSGTGVANHGDIISDLVLFPPLLFIGWPAVDHLQRPFIGKSFISA